MRTVKQIREDAIKRNMKDSCDWIRQIAIDIKYNISGKDVSERALRNSLKWAIDWIWGIGDE